VISDAFNNKSVHFVGVIIVWFHGNLYLNSTLTRRAGDRTLATVKKKKLFSGTREHKYGRESNYVILAINSR
jgi:hypothetical protein